MQSICVFCGSSFGTRPIYREAAIELGQVMAKENIALVWGGGKVGLMGTVADAVIQAGGEAIGVIPGFMVEKELAHPDASEMIEVDSMHTRKALMADRSEGFIAMPGGFGTFDELFEILTWAQLHIHGKPVGLLNTDGYYDPLLAMVEHSIREGFVRPSNLDLFVVASTPAELIAAMRGYQPPQGDWTVKLTTAQA